MVRRTLLLLAAAALLAVLAGCGSKPAAGGPVELKITASNLAFDQQELTLTAGRPVQLTLVNQDGVLHDWSVERIAVADKQEAGAAHGHSEAASRPDLHVAADAGATAALEFTPTEKGTYQFFCTVPGHRESGMEGTLSVQ